jgi:hypothetical protein
MQYLVKLGNYEEGNFIFIFVVKLVKLYHSSNYFSNYEIPIGKSLKVKCLKPTTGSRYAVGNYYFNIFHINFNRSSLQASELKFSIAIFVISISFELLLNTNPFYIW